MDDSDDDWLKDTTPAEPEPPPPPPPAATAKNGAKDEPKEAAWRAIARALLKDLPPKPKPYQHWARPRFLQYDYLYNYMHSYYNDYIEYLDKKQRGWVCEPPRAQTWAERALRQQVKPIPFVSNISGWQVNSDPTTKALMHTPHWANLHYPDHSKSYYYRKYKAILY